MDMSEYKKSEFPAQKVNRLQWQLDTIRANQETVGDLLLTMAATNPSDYRYGKSILADMHQLDRDAILQSEGILSDEQISNLKEG